MKLIELVNARDSLQKLILQDLPIRKAYELMLATETINRHLGFYGQEMTKLLADPGGEKQRELENFEVPDLEPVEIEMTEGLRLSAADVALLLPIIKFVEGGSD